MAYKQLIGCFVLLEIVLCCECLFLGCPPCELVECPELSCNASLQILEPECGCCSICVKADGEACGGLSNERCAPGSICRYRLGLILGENRTGICEPAECKRMQCNYRHFCGYREYRAGPRLVCHCPYYHCADKSTPLCGYNGRTYDSICHLQAIECWIDDFIGLKHFGPCPVTPEPPTDYLRTNTVPSSEDDLFNQPILAKSDDVTPVQHGCYYKGNEYEPDSMVKLNSCTYLHCDVNRSVAMVKVPGCPDGPIEPDYGVSEAAVPGGWTEWEELECVGTCFSATRTRRRFCTNPAPRYEGRFCSGPSEVKVKCIPEGCNYTCDYDVWSDWSTCSVTCGRGTQSRSRTLLTNITEEQANNCYLTETRSCAIVESCPTYCQLLYLGQEKVLDASGCETVDEWPVYKCAGPCSGEDCCTVSRTEAEKRAVQCPWLDWWVDSRFDVITECSCGDECQKV